MAKEKRKIIFFTVCGLFFLAFCFLSQADVVWANYGKASVYLDSIAGQPGVELKKETSETKMIGTIIGAVLVFLGVICLLIVIYAGIMIMMAEGNAEQVSKGKLMIIYAIIGLIIIAGSYALSYYVVDEVIKSTEKSSLIGNGEEEGEANETEADDAIQNDYQIGCCVNVQKTPPCLYPSGNNCPENYGSDSDPCHKVGVCPEYDGL